MQPLAGSVARRQHRRGFLVVALLVATVTACGRAADSDGGDAAPARALQGALADMEVDYGCGQGFYASDVDQTQGLFVFAADPQSSLEELGIPGRVEFPDDRWDAHIETGEELFANWCDDVIEPDDPEAVTDASFEVIGGTMTVTQDGPDRFTAELTDVEVQGSDGAVIDLGAVTTTNDLWGVYAG